MEVWLCWGTPSRDMTINEKVLVIICCFPQRAPSPPPPQPLWSSETLKKVSDVVIVYNRWPQKGYVPGCSTLDCHLTSFCVVLPSGRKEGGKRRREGWREGGTEGRLGMISTKSSYPSHRIFLRIINPLSSRYCLIIIIFITLKDGS